MRKRSEIARPDSDHHGLLPGLIRLHVLHHAVKEPVYGLAMIQELRRHGYELSAGTLYPILHGLEQKGLLTSAVERSGSTARRVYRATAAGRTRLWPPKPRSESCSENCLKTEEG